MPFGAIFGAIFFAFLSFWLLFVSSESLPLQAVKFFLALLGISLATALLLRRAWARWAGLMVAAATAVLILVVVSYRAGVGELVVLLGAVATAALLAFGPTGDVRRGLAAERRAAPHVGRLCGLATTVGVIGLAASLWWGSEQAEAQSVRAASDPAASTVTEIAGLPKRIRWSEFEDGMARAKAENKPMLVTFVTSWCGYCRKMDRTTWKDQAVIERLSDIVAVKVDGDSSPGLTAQFGVEGYPTTVLLDPSGRLLSRRGGYVDSRAILSWLDSTARRARIPGRSGNIPATSR